MAMSQGSIRVWREPRNRSMFGASRHAGVPGLLTPSPKLSRTRVAGLATPRAEGDCGVLAALVRVLDDVGDVGDPQTKGENRWQPKQSARSRTPLPASGRTATGGPIS